MKKVRKEKGELKRVERIVDRGQASAKNNLIKSLGRNEPMSDNKIKGMSRKVEKNLNSAVKLDKCLSPQALAFCQLVDDPWRADWEGVTNPTYPDTNPKNSLTIRCYGTRVVTVAAATQSTIIWCPGPADIGATDQNGFRLNRNISHSSTNFGVGGCPNYDTGAPADDGNCGWVNPNANVGTFLNQPVAGCVTLGWDTEVQSGEMHADNPSAFATRLVAAGIGVTPTGANQDLGGVYASTIIPEQTNGDFAGNAQAFALPTAHWERSDGTLIMNYLPSAADIVWSVPSVAAAVTIANGARANILLDAVNNVQQHYLIKYVAFFEITGFCVSLSGQVRLPLPDQGSIVNYSIKRATDNSERAGPNGDRLQKNLVQKHVQASIAETHPTLSKMVSKDVDKDIGHGKGLFKTFVDDVLPTMAEVVPLLFL